MTEPVFIGVDGGGSHTAACVVDAAGAVLGEAEAGPSNVHGGGLDAACQAIAEAAGAALRAASRASAEGMVCALSGAGRREEQEAVAGELTARGLARRVTVTHDAQALLAAGGAFEGGIAVISGTGSFVWGCNAAGAEARADGWGCLLGDEGSGFAIGQAGLRAACAFHDGRGPETTLLARALEHFQLAAAPELIARLAAPEIPRKAVAEFSLAVLRAAEGLDPLAVEIIDGAAGALARSAGAVRRRLEPPDRAAMLVCGGHLLRAEPLFRERFAALYRAGFRADELRFPQRSPEIGAAWLALRESGLTPPAAVEEEASPPDGGPEDAESRRVFEECRGLLTEQRNPRAAELDELSALEIVTLMNEEDRGVAPAVGTALPEIADTVERITEVFRAGGSLFYLGAGTSGRLGCLDASECPPTFGAPPEMVQGVVAGGVATLLRSREGAEDRTADAARDLELRGFGAGDFLVGIAASRRTPYVVAGLRYARELGAQTALITCSPPEEKPDYVDVLIAPVVGPEVVMGSTRLKAATAQKLVLNMLTTASMVRLGKVYENMMVDLQLSCGKLSERAKRIVMMITGLDYEAATALISSAGGSVKLALVMQGGGCSAGEAAAALERSGDFVRAAIRALEK